MLPWADTRPIAGQLAYTYTSGGTTYTGYWVGGIFGSWPSCCYSTSPAISGQHLMPSYFERVSTSSYVCYSVAPAQAVTLELQSNSYLVDQGYRTRTVLYNNVSVVCSMFDCIYPKREMLSDPVCVDLEDGGTLVTLSGITYRSTHSRRRHWVLELLLDGPLDQAGAPSVYPDIRKLWPTFLRRAELGVTICIDNTSWASFMGAPNSMSNTVPYGRPYYGCPTVIAGVITDCTSTRWSPGADNKMARMQVTMTIAEVTPPGVAS